MLFLGHSSSLCLTVIQRAEVSIARPAGLHESRARCISAQSISLSSFSILQVSRFSAPVFPPRSETLRDYFLGGRTAPWWAIACSIVATETSTLTIISTPGIAYAGNLGFLQIVLGYLVARVILCVVLIPQYFQGEFYTAYQLLEKRFGDANAFGGGGGFPCNKGAWRKAFGYRPSAKL